MLTDKVRTSMEASVLCWLATADANGQPNVSPKEVFRAFDDRHMVIANIASPVSAKNIEANPRVCVSLVDILVQKGHKIMGSAINVRRHTEDYRKWVAPLLPIVGDRFPVRSVFVIQVERTVEIVAPSYLLFGESTSESSQIEAAEATYGVRRLPGA
ncbi:MAG: pyridoxamine 5'-phosphate oxidase family protein [Pseudoxanthomonas sp.]